MAASIPAPHARSKRDIVPSVVLAGLWTAALAHDHYGLVTRGLVVLVVIVSVPIALIWAINAVLFWTTPSVGRRLLPAAAWTARVLSKVTGGIVPPDLEVLAWNFLGDDRVTEACERLYGQLRPDICPWPSVNTLVNAWITIGQYRRAVALPEEWSDEARAKGATAFPLAAALVQVNLVEAEYNLGLLADAKRRLSSCEAAVAAHPIARMGFSCQEAWIAALEGRSADARRHLGEADIHACPQPFVAEHHFTTAFVALSEGSFAAARTAAQLGLNLAMRTSSRRNGLFLLGRIAKAAGDTAGALEHFSAAIAHSYRGQGGDGLLAYANTLRDLGQSQRAAEAYQMVCDRDPESSACEQARAALAQLAPPSSAIN